MASVAVVLCCHSAWAANLDGSRLRSSLRWLSPKNAAAKTHSGKARMSKQRPADRWSKAAEPSGVLDTSGNEPISHSGKGARASQSQTSDGAGWQPLRQRAPQSGNRNSRREIRLTAGASDDPFAAGGEEVSDESLEASEPDSLAFQEPAGDDTGPLPPEVGFADEKASNDDQVAGDGAAAEEVVGPHFAVADDVGEPLPDEGQPATGMTENFDDVPLLAQRPGTRSAFDESGDPPPAENGRNELPEIGGGYRTKESEPERCPSPKDLKPISQITHRIAADPGLFPQECALSEEPFKPRNFQITTFSWKASALCHKPLYFQQPKLERYGHTFGPVLTPVLSAGHFFISVIALPYKMGMNPPWECVYPLGWYRPGSCAPYTLGPVPISLRGAATQGIVTTGLWFLFP